MDIFQVIKDLVMLGGVIAGVWLGLANRKKVNAEVKSVDATTADQLVKTAMAFVEPLRKELMDERTKRIELDTRVGIMQSEIAKMRWENAALRAGVTQLVYQVKSIGHKPVFDPETDMDETEERKK